jgi:hypothetical protein
MIKKNLAIFGLLILLTSCRLNVNPVNRIIDYENPKSELIKALFTEQEASALSDEFNWYKITFTQRQYVDPDTSSPYEQVQSFYSGNFQSSNYSVMIYHTIHKFDSPIDKNKPTKYILGNIVTFNIVTSYIPDISASGDVVSKCSVDVKEAKQVCDVHLKYNYIESYINITTYNIGKEAASKWLNAIVSVVEPQIMSQELRK